MKICHVMTQFWLGGTEMIVTDMINGQVKRGHQVRLFVMDASGDEAMLSRLDPSVGVTFIPRDMSTRNQLTRNVIPFGMLNLRLRVCRPDIVHLHGMGLPRGVAGMRRRKLMTLHYTLSKVEPLDNIDHIIAISGSVQDYLREKCGRDSSVIYNGVSTEGIALRDSMPWRDVFRIVQVGRLDCRTKAQDLTIRALRRLKDAGIDDISVDFIGVGDDMARLRALADEEEVADRVNWRGALGREEVMRQLRQYDLMVVPSRSESFGLVVAEGMAARLPVLVSDIDGPAEIVGRGRYGRMFRPDDEEEYAGQILSIKENYPQALEMARKGYDHVVSAFSIDAMVDNYMAYYAGMSRQGMRRQVR